MDEMMNPMNAPVTAQEISGELMEDTALQAQQEAASLEAGIREGIAELFEDGWTQEELMALSQDMGVREAVAKGHDVVRAACAYLRAQLQAMRSQAYDPMHNPAYNPAYHPMRRRAVPVSRVSGAGSAMQGSGIEQMTDAQFEAFSRQAREAAMMGRKVRM